MFSLNYLNVTIWVLGGILLLVAIGLVIWRATPNGKKAPANSLQNKVGSVSNEMNQLVLSMNSIYGYKIVFNALVKNRFSKSKYSLVPAVVAHNGNVFLLTNTIKVKNGELNISESQDPFWNDKRKSNVAGFKMAWYKDIEKYINNLNEDVNIVKIIPIVGSIDNVRNDSSMNVVDVHEIGEWIQNYNSSNKIESYEEDDLLNKINRDNLMRARALPKNKLRRLVD